MPASEDDAKLFREGLLWASERGVAQELPEYAQQAYELLNVRYAKLEDYRLNQIVKHQYKDECTLSNEGFVYLQALQPNWTIPILTAKWKFRGSVKKVQIRIGLFRPVEGSPGEICSSGFRFEVPDESSKHAFHHVQPITSMTQDDAPFPGCNPKLDTSGPTFPIDADGASDLLLCLLLSLYGIPILEELKPALPKLLERCQQMRFRGAN